MVINIFKECLGTDLELTNFDESRQRQIVLCEKKDLVITKERDVNLS